MRCWDRGIARCEIQGRFAAGDYEACRPLLGCCWSMDFGELERGAALGLEFGTLIEVLGVVTPVAGEDVGRMGAPLLERRGRWQITSTNFNRASGKGKSSAGSSENGGI
ncbi:hypothetical protein MLD38_022021 [Melastoma candidum]|uniref:Uncharacterized protein n=1 Tax=Melastoma candidum TaxID=119954 RepID=A0ACB9QHU1_9MYRT|nr:hypothetical protein MLD38_022021 [Melastoma candidum]